LGSLGEQFPDTDPSWRGADSAIFVARARDLAAERGLGGGNLDAIVIAESPRLAPHVSEMGRKVAGLLGVETEFVSIRGTSSHGLGFARRGEGIGRMGPGPPLPRPQPKIKTRKSQTPMTLPRLHPITEAVRSRPRQVEWVLFDSSRRDRRINELKALCRERGVSVRY